jgi:hypothetical protein
VREIDLRISVKSSPLEPAKRATENAARFLSPASRACSACREPFPRLTPWASKLSPASRADAGPLRGLSGQSVRTCYVRIRVKDKRTMFPVTFLSRTRVAGIGSLPPGSRPLYTQGRAEAGQRAFGHAHVAAGDGHPQHVGRVVDPWTATIQYAEDGRNRGLASSPPPGLGEVPRVLHGGLTCGPVDRAICRASSRGAASDGQ